MKCRHARDCTERARIAEQFEEQKKKELRGNMKHRSRHYSRSEETMRGIIKMNVSLVSRLEKLEQKQKITTREEKKEQKSDLHVTVAESKKVVEEQIIRKETQCDTPFRLKFKKIADKYFHIDEYGVQSVRVL